MQSLCQGKGQRSHNAKNRRKHFRGEIGRAISNLVAVLVSDLWAMAGKNGTVFFNNWPSRSTSEREPSLLGTECKCVKTKMGKRRLEPISYLIR